MKVLHVIDTLETGGTEQSLLALGRNLSASTMAVVHIYPGRRLGLRFESAGIPVHSLEVRKRYGFQQAVERLTSVVAKEAPDLIHVQLFRAALVARFAKGRLGKPLVETFVSEPYGAARLKELRALQRFKVRALQIFDALTARRVDAFLANSQAILESNCKALWLPRERCQVIYRGRDPQFFHPRATESAKLRKELGLPERVPLILNVGRLERGKGQEELVRSLPEVLKHFPEAHLVVGGEGPHRGHLTALSQSLGLARRVHLLGTVDDVRFLLWAADLFAFSSHYEGFPGALIEAMMTALPIVATDIPVHREAIRDGREGLLVPSQREGAFSHAICRLLGNPEWASSLGKNAREAAVRRFEIGEIALSHERFYRALLGRSATSEARSPVSMGRGTPRAVKGRDRP